MCTQLLRIIVRRGSQESLVDAPPTKRLNAFVGIAGKHVYTCPDTHVYAQVCAYRCNFPTRSLRHSNSSPVHTRRRATSFITPLRFTCAHPSRPSARSVACSISVRTPIHTPKQFQLTGIEIDLHGGGGGAASNYGRGSGEFGARVPASFFGTFRPTNLHSCAHFSVNICL